MDSFDIEYKIEQRDFARFLLSHRAKSRSFYIVLVLFIAIIAYQIFSRRNLWVILIYCALLAVYLLIPYQRARKLYKSQKDLKMRIFANDKGFRLETQNDGNDFGWGQVTEVVDSETEVTVYLGKERFLIIPRRVLNDEQINFVKKNINIKGE